MSIKVATWNTMRQLTDETKRASMLEEVKQIDADVALFTEAYEESSEKLLLAAKEALTSLGYVALTADYNDTDDRQDRHGFLAISRINLNSELTPVWARGRTYIGGQIIDPDTYTPVKFAGVHFDDRSESERLYQISRLASDVGNTGPAVLVGDQNTFDGTSRKAKFIQKLAPLAQKFPEGEPIFGRKTTLLGRIGSLGRRVCEMAEGRTMEALREMNFTDADDLQQPTYTFLNRPLLQLDHIMTRDAGSSDFTVHQNRCGSDHFAISAVIET